MSNVFTKIGKGIKWTGEELLHLVTDVPKALSKLIVLSDDAKAIASDADKEVILVFGDVTALVAAVAKDDGASLQAIATLISAGGSAIAAGGTNIPDDAAVLAAASTFFKSINGTNYADVLAAIAKLISDGKTSTAVVIQDFKKLGADATS